MLNPNYIVGFVDGEGCFSITVNRHQQNRLEVRLVFEIEVREDDKNILCQIKESLQCGNIYQLSYDRYQKWRPHVKYKVSNFRDIQDKIIPFFTTHPLQAKKRFQFAKFCFVAKMMQKKKHLTEVGIQQILEIRSKDSLDALDAHVQWGAIEVN